MHVTLIACGRLKEAYLRDASKEYSKRLSSYITLDIKELDDGPDMASEAARMLRNIKNDMYIITLEINGRQMTSEDFADTFKQLMNEGQSHICFIIGGSDGLDKSITDMADLHLSFSKMTFPHQLMRIIFLEQLYRAFKIIKNEPYHK
ncbi:MAG: 23S rRNA (pseudouridine(1915)-N(3))-methyltransferase RlmH [Lachnospiraceae bacterium]|nr:23S rRNA (pseudouridine(1915)-N(3))-methyltransferase RlmH [Lachnospiraceae bacterium]